MARRRSWARLSMDAWALGLEASTVIGLRTLRMAQGGAAAEREALLMVNEKIASGLALQTMALTSGLGVTAEGAAAKTLAHYRRKVQANRRRLSKI